MCTHTYRYATAVKMRQLLGGYTLRELDKPALLREVCHTHTHTNTHTHACWGVLGRAAGKSTGGPYKRLWEACLRRSRKAERSRTRGVAQVGEGVRSASTTFANSRVAQVWGGLERVVKGRATNVSILRLARI